MLQFLFARNGVSYIPLLLCRRQINSLKKSLNSIFQYYEDVIGLTAVKTAHDEVLRCEEALNAAQTVRREKQLQIKGLQARLKDIHTELDRTSRGEDKYLDLLTEEHSAIKKERAVLEDFENAETVEREAFHTLSARVRFSHEKERERGERTKYWSISASLLGALLGIVGTTAAAELRMKRIKEIVPTTAQLTPMLSQVTEIIEKQNQHVSSFLNDLRNIMKFGGAEKDNLRKAYAEGEISTVSGEAILASLNEQNGLLRKEMDELKQLIAVDRNLEVENSGIVYVGSNMEMLLDKTEKNIESKMKLQTLLLSVVGFYVAFAVSLILVGVLKDN